MKSRETKQRDLEALTASLAGSKSAMVVSFSKVTVNKDQELRNRLREAGAQYQVVKNTLARIAVKGTDFEQATDAFKGVTAIAWTDSDPVILSKAISKFMKDNADTYTFKTGVVDGKLVDLSQVTAIASLPSKEELISKLLYVINAQAQRLVTVINAVPRDLAVVIKQIGEKDPAERGGAGATKAEASGEQGDIPAPNIPEDKDAPAAEGPADSSPAEPPADANPGSESQSPSEDILQVPSATDTPVADQPDAPAAAAEEAQQSKEDRQDATAPEAQTSGEGEGDAEETKPE